MSSLRSFTFYRLSFDFQMYIQRAGHKMIKCVLIRQSVTIFSCQSAKVFTPRNRRSFVRHIYQRIFYNFTANLYMILYQRNKTCFILIIQ